MTVVVIGPIVLAYPFVQKYFVKGITIGASKADGLRACAGNRQVRFIDCDCWDHIRPQVHPSSCKAWDWPISDDFYPSLNRNRLSFRKL